MSNAKRRKIREKELPATWGRAHKALKLERLTKHEDE